MDSILKMEFTPDEDAPEFRSEPYVEMAELAKARRASYRPHIDPGSVGFLYLRKPVCCPHTVRILKWITSRLISVSLFWLSVTKQFSGQFIITSP